MLQRVKKILFLNSHTSQIIFKNTFWLFSSETLSRLFRMGLIIYATRILGKDGWGLFSYTLSLVAVFMTFADIGLSPLATRVASQDSTEKEEILSTIFYLKLFLIISIFFIVIFAAPFTTKISAASPIIPIVALLLFLDSLREFLFSLNRATQKLEREGLIKIATSGLIVLFGFYFLIVSPSPMHFALAYLLGSFLGTLWLIILISPIFKKLWGHFSKEKIWLIVQSAWPIAIIALFGDILLNIDNVIIGWLKTAGEVGLYSAAQRLVLTVYMFSSIFTLALFPLFSHFVLTDTKKFIKLLEKSMATVFLVGLPIVAGGIILRQPIILFVFGKEYLEASTVFAILLLTVLAVFPNFVLERVIYSYNLQKKFVVPTFVGLLINILLNIILIPMIGIKGSAIATVIAQSIIVVWNWIKLKQINDFNIKPSMKNIVLALLLMTLITICLQYFSVNLALTVLLSATIYVGTLFLLKEPILKELWKILVV